ncbi:hypothetical protein B8W72_03190 [Pseudomonas putida]|uniref:Uncharacterized protein n=1 Tax=Pseudomonas putida TaxID=303 RepID=A0A1Y3LIM4_PSEPU|nr:hypothetical protein B8W72_03190 [Pseudomonas putida]
MAPASPVFAGEPAPTGSAQASGFCVSQLDPQRPVQADAEPHGGLALESSPLAPPFAGKPASTALERLSGLG